MHLFLCFLFWLALVRSDDEIFKLIQQNDVEQLKLKLTTDNKNERGPGQQTPIMHAVLTGKVDVVEFLLANDVDLTLGEKDGYTPMHGAGFQGRAAIAQLLIDAGVDPNTPHSDGFLPLHRACWGQDSRHLDTMRVFLKNGVDPDVKAGNGQTCADFAGGKSPKAKDLLAAARKKFAAKKEL